MALSNQVLVEDPELAPPRCCARAKKKGTRWPHYESMYTKRAFGFRGMRADALGLIAVRDYRYRRCVTSGTIPNVRVTLIHSGSFCTTAYWLICALKKRDGPALVVSTRQPDTDWARKVIRTQPASDPRTTKLPRERLISGKA
jgi:hypothetical protein